MPENRSDTESTWTDPDDAPELTDAWFRKADLYHGETLVRRGRPAGLGRKTAVTLRIDTDVLDAFKATGQGWQTRMNEALKGTVGALRPDK